jgi:hypothetical protein
MDKDSRSPKAIISKGSAAPQPRSIVFRCGFFQAQFSTTFDIPIALHIISADLLGRGATEPVAWNAVFGGENLVTLAELLNSNDDGQHGVALIEELQFLAPLRRRLGVPSGGECCMCRAHFQQHTDLLAHWRGKCLKALSAAGGGQPITV